MLQATNLVAYCSLVVPEVLATGNPNVKFSWANFEKIVCRRYGVDFVGWPLDIPIVDPKLLSKEQRAEILLLFEYGEIRMARVSDEVLDRWRLQSKTSKKLVEYALLSTWLSIGGLVENVGSTCKLSVSSACREKLTYFCVQTQEITHFSSFEPWHLSLAAILDTFFEKQFLNNACWRICKLTTRFTSTSTGHR